MFTATADRVKANTSCSVNRAIREATERSVARVASQGSAAIERRLRELDREWDVERYLETMAPTISLIGLALGIGMDRRLLTLPVLVQAFFLLHAVQGWCPPLPVLRSLGVRTMEEIETERIALKIMRGDFEHVPHRAETVMQAAEA